MNKGQTIIEVIVALSVVTIMVTGLIVGTTMVTKSTRYASRKSQAQKYVQEALELARITRDSEGWETFKARSGMYCVGSNNTIPASPSDTCNWNIDGIFKRYLNFTWNGSSTPNRMEVTSTVCWEASCGSAYSSQVKTYFTNWR